MSDQYILASDIGSSGCKTVLLTAGGRVVAAARRDYPTVYPQPGWVEQMPDDWYTALCATIRAVLKESRVPAGRIAGVGIVGVTHNTVLLDERDRPLCPSIMLFDIRSAPQVQAILARWNGTVRERTLNDVTPVWSWPQLLWIREHRADVWRATRRVLFQKDYVRHRLAPSPVTDVIDASGSLLFDPINARWIREFCDDLELDPSWLPEPVDPMTRVGAVGAQGAADTGLQSGTPVIAGTTDTVAEVVGSGAVRRGAAVVKLASVGRIAVVSPTPVRRPHILNYRHVLDGLWYPGTASKFAASAYRWLRDLFHPAAGGDIYRRMDEAAAQVPAGAHGLIFHPHLMGQWAPHWDDRLRGDFLGLTVRHGPGHLMRAVLEGVAFGLRDALAAMEDGGLAAGEIRLIGQGSKSALWRRIVANVLDRPLAVPAQPDASFGAGLITGMGVNLVDRSADAVEDRITYEAQIAPEPELAAVYDRLFDIYRDADRALQTISARLSAFDHESSRLKASLSS
jgi:xylulokinase